MPHLLAKLSEVVKRFFGSRVVSSSDKKPQVEPVGPSTPRLPLEILFDIADLVLFSLQDRKDSYHTFACSLSAVSRAFYRQYCHFRRSRTLIVRSEPHALVILDRLGHDAALAAAVTRLVISENAWFVGKAPRPETIRCIRRLLVNLSQLELRFGQRGFSSRTIQALTNAVSITGCSLILGNILDSFNLPALKILQIDIQLLRPHLLTLDRLHLILYFPSDFLPYPHTPTSLVLVFPLPLIPSLVAQHRLTLLSPISRASLLSNPHWSALVQRFLDAGAAVHHIEHACEELFRRRVVEVLGRRAPREYFYS
ncbi:hypothetical protein JCM8097_005750 [Rhodosporidiobolus ruineniae]